MVEGNKLNWGVGGGEGGHGKELLCKEYEREKEVRKETEGGLRARWWALRQCKKSLIGCNWEKESTRQITST